MVLCSPPCRACAPAPCSPAPGRRCLDLEQPPEGREAASASEACRWWHLRAHALLALASLACRLLDARRLPGDKLAAWVRGLVRAHTATTPPAHRPPSPRAPLGRDGCGHLAAFCSAWLPIPPKPSLSCPPSRA